MAVVYDIVREYLDNPDKESPDHDLSLSTSPGWCLAIVRLGRPLTYSRKFKQSVGDVTSGAFERKEKPLIISDECVQLSISRAGASHTKTLNAILKSARNNYLSANAVLPGDWLFAWCHNNIDDTQKIIKNVLEGRPANDFMSGLKFVGRVHSIRKRTAIEGDNKRTVTYTLQGVGFKELDTEFYYDVHLATSAAQGGLKSIAMFMAQLGLDWTMFVGETTKKSGNIKDNMGQLIPALVDIVIGAGRSPSAKSEDSSARAYAGAGDKGISKGSLIEGGPQANQTIKQMREAPYSYMIPVSAASILGKTPLDKTKSQSVYGYSDILHLLVGVQQFSGETTDLTKGFWPILNKNENDRDIPVSSDNRSFCPEPVKGTYLPQEGNFINKPLWSMLEQFLNPAINQMYTALKVTPQGTILPTLVVRQIPFSTDVIEENDEMPLTRFLNLPRWKIDPILVKYIDVGRSDATHFNLVKVIGDATMFSNGQIQDAARQNFRNPPIYDGIDIGRSGVRSSMQTVNCTIGDITRDDGLRVWAEAIADWQFGSQYTLNGQVVCKGIQSPIAEYDNIELEGIVYNIESITDNCSVTERGKSFNTILSVTNGMPAAQENSDDFPRYPGFHIIQDKNQKQNDEEFARFAEDFKNSTGLEPPEKTEVFDNKTTDDTTGYDEDMTSLDPQMNEDT